MLRKYIILLTFQFLVVFGLSAQDKNAVLPPNWYNLDLLQSGYFGISTERAYTELLKDKNPKAKIIVAVIDGGTDVQHPDFKDVLWVNKKEIPGNGIDDDNNGYIDDIYGWNFIGSKDGNLQYDNLELVRILRKLKPKYLTTLMTTVLDSAERAEFRVYKRAEIEFGKKYDEASQAFPIYIAIKGLMDSVAKVNGKVIPTLEEIDKYKADDYIQEQVKKIIRKGSKDEGSIEKFYKTIKKGYQELDAMLRYNLNENFDDRARLVGDDYANSYERFYGNADVKGPDADHGTHVSGIIGANRLNDLGIQGIANSVEIMSLRVVPTGDERDKDVANAIRYAVDNGAKVINMSFGKGFKWDKKVVDAAVQYAEEKGVLLVHAAGNDNLNLDENENYPNKYYETPEYLAYLKKNEAPFKSILPIMQNPNAPNATMGRGGMNRPGAFNKPPVPAIDTVKFSFPQAKNWIEVGASTIKDDDNLKASFSNYGKYTVDVFAPGFRINSTVPDGNYEEFDGTSMAAPVVSGLAAMLWSYYPDFTAVQIKDIIMKSAVKSSRKVKLINEKGESLRVPFSDLSVSGGIVNAYEAFKLAEKYK
ncbi:MAG: peptidase S8 [Pedobacter sp.]|nr:MAG: peptidase S8 [Pedobacter sp.]